MSAQDLGCELQKHGQLLFNGSLHFKTEEARDEGVVFFREGKLYAAQFGIIRGKCAIQHLLRLKSFAVTQKSEEFPRVEIQEHLDELLVEAMQAEIEGRDLEEPAFNPIALAPLPQSDKSNSSRVFIFELEGQSWVLECGRYMIGRNSVCHVCVSNDNVSSFHCIVDVTSASITIHDFHSTNGTFINGNKVEDLAQIEAGDTLALGPINLTLRTGLRIRHLKNIIPATPIDLTRLDQNTAQMPHAHQETIRSAGDEPIRFEQKPERASTWKLPRIWRQG